jgi:hypothetical protein
MRLRIFLTQPPPALVGPSWNAAIEPMLVSKKRLNTMRFAVSDATDWGS